MESKIIAIRCEDIIHLKSTSSTNDYIKQLSFDGTMIVVVAEEQIKGRGCGTNTWESEPFKNLTFSIRYRPVGISARQQFIISMQTAVALCRTLNDFNIPTTIKWPNDIYYNDKKLCGILIENRLQGTIIEESIIGIGLNINQQTFVSDAPNPISMLQICGKEIDREAVLHNFLFQFSNIEPNIAEEYRSLLYRKHGVYSYRDGNGDFMAEIINVGEDGILTLRDANNIVRKYAFKEVRFM